MLVHEERAIRQNERRRILHAIRLHSDLGDVADLQRLVEELRGEARTREKRDLALLCGALLLVLEADVEPDVGVEVSQIDRWLGAA